MRSAREARLPTDLIVEELAATQPNVQRFYATDDRRRFGFGPTPDAAKADWIKRYG